MDSGTEAHSKGGPAVACSNRDAALPRDRCGPSKQGEAPLTAMQCGMDGACRDREQNQAEDEGKVGRHNEVKEHQLQRQQHKRGEIEHQPDQQLQQVVNNQHKQQLGDQSAMDGNAHGDPTCKAHLHSHSSSSIPTTPIPAVSQAPAPAPSAQTILPADKETVTRSAEAEATAGEGPSAEASAEQHHQQRQQAEGDRRPRQHAIEGGAGDPATQSELFGTIHRTAAIAAEPASTFTSYQVNTDADAVADAVDALAELDTSQPDTDPASGDGGVGGGGNALPTRKRVVDSNPKPPPAITATTITITTDNVTTDGAVSDSAAAAAPPKRRMTCDGASIGNGCVALGCEERNGGGGGCGGGRGVGGGCVRRIRLRSRSLSDAVVGLGWESPAEVEAEAATWADEGGEARRQRPMVRSDGDVGNSGVGGVDVAIDSEEEDDEYDDALELGLDLDLADLRLDLEFGLGLIDARDSFASAGGVVPGVGEVDAEAAAATAATAVGAATVKTMAAAAVAGVDGGAGFSERGLPARRPSTAGGTAATLGIAEERAVDAVLNCLDVPAGGRPAVLAEAMVDVHGGFHDLPQQLHDLQEQRREAQGTPLKRRQFVTRLMRLRLFRRVLGSRGLLLRDKLSFLMGTTMMWACAFWLGRSPSTFYLLYGGLGTVLMAARWALYFSRRWHYYLYDFCYYANLLLVLQLWMMPRCATLSKVTFSYNTGPLAWSILTFRNSLVFHDLDKVTSLFLHLVPALVSWSLRWHGDQRRFGPPGGARAEERAHWHSASFDSNVLLPMVFYVAWALAYYLKIFVFSRAKIQQRGYRTLFNFVTTQKKLLGSHGAVGGCCERVHLARWQLLLRGLRPSVPRATTAAAVASERCLTFKTCRRKAVLIWTYLGETARVMMGVPEWRIDKYRSL